MSSNDTKTMQPAGGQGKAGRFGDGDAGLVLLYAPNFEELPPAFALNGRTALIGREPGEAGLAIPQAAASRIHAQLECRDDGFWIRDLNSRNGVFVDQEKKEVAKLYHGAQIRIGDAVFEFVERDAAAYAQYRIDGVRYGDAPGSTIEGAVGGLTMARLSAELDRVAPTDLAVLVLGETGTGKELVSRAIHSKSGRAGPFRAINCAAVPAALVESQLFGHRKGAFTGADRNHEGIIRSADGGTLLLDEIGDMPLEVQAKLLRMLETREVLAVGAVHSEPVDVRVVSATHRDLRAHVKSGLFRADLLARLGGYSITLPALRDRKEDLYALVRHFLAVTGAEQRAVSFGFMHALCAHEWPYNVRELLSAVRRAAMVSTAPQLEEADLPAEVLEANADRDDGELQASAPRVIARPAKPTAEEMSSLLVQHQGNVAAVGRALGRNRSLVHRWMVEFGLDPSSFR